MGKKEFRFQTNVPRPRALGSFLKRDRLGLLTELGHGLGGGVADAVVAADPVGFLNLVAVELDAPDAVRLHRSAAVPAQPAPVR